jgi:hypothetical protein
LGSTFYARMFSTLYLTRPCDSSFSKPIIVKQIQRKKSHYTMHSCLQKASRQVDAQISFPTVHSDDSHRFLLKTQIESIRSLRILWGRLQKSPPGIIRTGNGRPQERPQDPKLTLTLTRKVTPVLCIIKKRNGQSHCSYLIVIAIALYHKIRNCQSHRLHLTCMFLRSIAVTT